MYIRCKHVVALIYKLYCCFEKRNKWYFPFNRLIKVIKKKIMFSSFKKKINAIKIGYLSEVMDCTAGKKGNYFFFALSVT